MALASVEAENCTSESLNFPAVNKPWISEI